MREKANEYYREALRQLAAGHAAIMIQYERTIALLEAELARTMQDLPSASIAINAPEDAPRIDEQMLTVVFRDHQCFLGNTVALRLFRRLLRARNHYVRHDDLLEHVWGGIRTGAAIRSAVKELRRRLREAGMDELADAIDGHVTGHYGLMLDRLE